LRLKSLENTLCLIAASATRAKRAAKRASDDAIDTAAAHQMAYPVPKTIKARAVSAAVRVARSNTCTALRAAEEVEELVTTLTDQVARLKGVTT
jgi:hypothetical protein